MCNFISIADIVTILYLLHIPLSWYIYTPEKNWHIFIINFSTNDILNFSWRFLSSNLLVALSPRHPPRCWLLQVGQVYSGLCHPQAGRPGLHTIGRWVNQKEQTSRQYSSLVSLSAPVLEFLLCSLFIDCTLSLK